MAADDLEHSYSLTKDSILDVANQIFFSATKNANFMLLERLHQALTGRNIFLVPNASRK